MKNMLVLVRGLPGSGKTTFAKRLVAAGFFHFEADKFFEVGGHYCFDRSKLGDAHAQCFERAMQALDDGYDAVVSNTFTRFWEMQKYIEGAKSRGVTVHIVETRGEFQNVHGVPESAIQAMKARWEALPADIKTPEAA